MPALWITLLLAPVVQVRGHARITLLDTAIEGGTLRLRGELRDRDLLTALPERDVEIHLLGGWAHRDRLRTGAGGDFEAAIEVVPGQTSVIARFAGDASYLDASTGPVPLRAEQAPVALEIRGPSEIRLSDPEVGVELLARSSGAAASVEVRLRNGAGVSLGTFRTGDDFTLVRLPTRSLGSPGPVRVVATTEGGGQATLEAMLFAPVRLEIDALPDTAIVGDRIEVRGSLTEEGTPIADSPIAIRVRGQTIASVRTDARGAFVAALDTGALSEGPADVEAVYAPHVPWREAGRSGARSVRLVAPIPLPLAAAIAPIAALLTPLLVQRLIVRRRRRPAVAPEPPDPGLRPAAQSTLRAVLRRPERTLHGTLWDPFHDRPVAGGTVTLRAFGQPDILAPADEGGGVRIPAPPGDRYAATAAAPGYLALSFDVTLPHRGDFSGFVLHMEPVRAGALRLWREQAAPIASRERLDHITPTELAARDHALTPAARAFEAIFFSGAPSDESALDPLRRP